MFIRLLFVSMLTCFAVSGSQIPLVYKDMSNTDGLMVFGSASQAGQENEILELNPSNFNQIGGAFTYEKVNIEAFHVSFRVRISEEATGAPDCNGQVGGDGLSFIIGRTQDVGGGGGGLGFRGLDNSVAVVVDTYCNTNFNDPGSNFIAIHTDGNVEHTSSTPSEGFGDARDLYVWVDYRGGVLFVRYNNSDRRPDHAQIQQVIDIPRKMDGLKGFLGIVGATGGGAQKNELLSFTYHPPVPPVRNFKPEWFVVNRSVSQGGAFINFDWPNSDGILVPSNDRLGYGLSVEKDGAVISGLGFFPTSHQTGRITVPQLTLPLDGKYQLRISRYFESNPGARSEEWLIDINPDNLASTPPNHQDYDRWLLHIPRRGSGFSTTLKLTNRLGQTDRVFLQAFNDESDMLGARVVGVPGNGTAYFDIHGDLFASSIQEVSHIAVVDTFGFVDVELEYKSTSTDYAAWAPGIDFRDGKNASSRLEMDAAAAQFLDGVAIANLRNLDAVDLYIVQYDRKTRAKWDESYQGKLQPGEKRAIIVTSLFNHRPNTVYAFETRKPNHFLTGLGLSFNGFEFFSTKPLVAR